MNIKVVHMLRSFKSLDQESDAAARVFHAEGITEGTRVLLAVRPGHDLIVGMFGLLKLGAVPIAIDPGMGWRSTEACIRRTQPEAIVGLRLATFLSRLPLATFRSLRIRLTVGTSRWRRQLQQCHSTSPRPLAEVSATAPAAILFTSGSTGAPKGVSYTHGMFDAQIELVRETFGIQSGEVDMAIRYGGGRYPGLEVHRLISETVIPVISPDLHAQNPLNAPSDLANHVLLHDGSPDPDDSCPDWTMWLAARGMRSVDGARGPRFNQSSLVIEAAVNGRGVALAKRTIAQDDLDAGRLISPLQISTAVDFAYYLVHPKAKGRLPQVKAFIAWITAEATAHEEALRAIDNGAGI